MPQLLITTRSATRMVRLAALGFVLATCCIAVRVGADAMPMPIDNCPCGTVSVRRHTGASCEKEPPENCPLGWRGAIGGDCVLDTCTSDAECAPQEKLCRSFSLCYEPREGWSGRGVVARKFTVWIPVNLCRGAEKCASPSECRAGKLCVPENAPPPVVLARKPDGTVDTRPADVGSRCTEAPVAKTVGIAGATAAVLAGIGLLVIVIWRAARQA